MTKVAALKANQITVRSPLPRKPPPPPSSPPRKWKQFNVFAEEAEDMLALQRGRGAAYPTDELPKLTARCKRALEAFDPEDNYDDEGDLAKDYIAERLGVMLAAWDWAPREAYIKLLIEHVSAVRDLSALALESGCRKLELEWIKDRAPPIGIVVKAMDAAAERWWRRANAIRQFDLEQALRAQKSKATK